MMTEREFAELMRWLGAGFTLVVCFAFLIFVWGMVKSRYAVSLIALMIIYVVLSLSPFDWEIGYGDNYKFLRRFRFGDSARNVLMYVPLGGLLAIMIRPRSFSAFAGCLLVIVGVSLMFEFAQLFVASRVSAANDLISNAFGGALGLAIGIASGILRRQPLAAGRGRQDAQV
jgi:glycopeptide antibiotics resistance protein